MSKTPAPPSAKPAIAREPWPEMAPRARILLVDDDERNLLALTEVLEPLADVITATSGRLALRELLKDDFAVILLDVFMPDMDGYETAALIRQRSQTARIPIIFLSAVNKETEHLMRGYAMGAVDYVFKPVDPIVLKSKVAVFVDLFLLRQQVAGQARAEQELREEKLRADTERLAVERELQHARLRQAAIIESLPMVLYLEPYCEIRQVPDFVSGDIEAMTGLKYEDMKANPTIWFERVHSDDRDRLVEALRERSVGGKLSIEYRWQCADGSYKHLLDQAVLLRDDGGNPVEFAGSVIDVTAQRELERQLVQSRKAEALGQLTGGIAHDFNNLLAAVLGGLRLLETRVEFGEREQKIVEHMRHAAESGAELVRRLMAFARKQELLPTSVDPRRLCKSVAGLVEHTLGGLVTVEWQVPDKGPQLFVDEAQLELALVNLLINARDAMPDGGKVAVSIDETTITDEAGEQRDFLRIRVSDEGGGIAPELIERVTEPFFTTKAAGKGTGLGLSMVAGFVEQSGGMFRIRSEAGHGTVVEMILPTTRVAGRTERARDPEHAANISIGSVLVVDDDESVRLILSEQLRDLGLDVAVAEDGERAMQMLANGAGATELVLTDFSMPGLDGMALLEAVRKKWPKIKGAIMTGNPQESLARCDPTIPVIHKPINQNELKRLLSES